MPVCAASGFRGARAIRPAGLYGQHLCPSLWDQILNRPTGGLHACSSPAQVRRVGTLVKQPEAAEAAAAALERRVTAAVAAVPPRADSERPCVACLEWVSPIFVGG